MPDLTGLLGSAADAIAPGPVPPFSRVQRRLRRRRLVRTGSILGVGALAAGGVVGLASLSGGHRDAKPVTPQPVTPQPCVTRTDQNARDALLAIPRSGTRQVHIEVWSTFTVGWLPCGETGDLTLSAENAKSFLLGAPNSGFAVPATNVSSARYQAFHSGTVTLTGTGSLGSAGTLEIIIGPVTEPVGASDPSPFPGRAVNEDVPQLCLTADAADSDGRVRRTVSFNTATLAPAPEATSRFTAAEILHRFGVASWAVGIEGHPKAYFGALTDNNTNPFPKGRALWVVVVCDAPQFAGHGGPYVGPAPAPGTSPSPGGRYLGVISVPYDEDGHALGESITNYADTELLSEMLFEVPFNRNQQDASAGRQIGLTYRSDDSCSTFDHLGVQEFTDHTVYVRVWLRLIGNSGACPGTGDVHDVTVGLRQALGERPLIRGVPPR